MDTKEIKKGEIYKLELLCILNKENVIIFETPTGDHIPLRSSDVECVSPANGTKNAETAPKYDPCRLFRKGDKVRVKRRDGRCNGKDGEYLREAFCKVVEDETRNELVRVLHNATEYRLDPAYLELVEPVEELEPYCVNLIYDCDDGILIGYEVAHENGVKEAIFYGGKGCIRTLIQAKAAAEAERDRLNAEYRKELE